MLAISGFNFFKPGSGVLAKFAAVCIGFSLSGCTSWQLTEKAKDPSAPETADQKLFQAERFGEEKSIPIDAGYFIYRGKYIPPPYTVKKIGLSIHVNDIMVMGPIKWTAPDAKVPENPPDIPNVSMLSGSDAINSFIDDTFIYYQAVYRGSNPPKDKTLIQSVAERISKLSNVWSAIPDEERKLIRITMCNFRQFNVSTSALYDKANVDISEEALREMYSRAFDRYVDFFKNNKIVYRGLKVTEIEWIERTKTFYEAVKVLNDTKTWTSSKMKALEKLDFGSEKINNELISTFKPSKELEKRLYDDYVKSVNLKQESAPPSDKFKR
ncbi:MAG: hypothetical protein WC637_06815 [Victivallales bacterium]